MGSRAPPHPYTIRISGGWALGNLYFHQVSYCLLNSLKLMTQWARAKPPLEGLRMQVLTRAGGYAIDLEEKHKHCAWQTAGHLALGHGENSVKGRLGWGNVGCTCPITKGHPLLSSGWFLQLGLWVHPDQILPFPRGAENLDLSVNFPNF